MEEAALASGGGLTKRKYFPITPPWWDAPAAAAAAAATPTLLERGRGARGSGAAFAFAIDRNRIFHVQRSAPLGAADEAASDAAVTRSERALATRHDAACEGRARHLAAVNAQRCAAAPLLGWDVRRAVDISIRGVAPFYDAQHGYDASARARPGELAARRSASAACAGGRRFAWDAAHNASAAAAPFGCGGSVLRGDCLAWLWSEPLAVVDPESVHGGVATLPPLCRSIAQRAGDARPYLRSFMAATTRSAPRRDARLYGGADRETLPLAANRVVVARKSVLFGAKEARVAPRRVDVRPWNAHAECHSLLKAALRPWWNWSSQNQLQFPDRRLVQWDCGKLQTLDRLLRRLKAGKHRCLIFTQMSKMLNVLEVFLNLHGHTYLRLDGSTHVEARQQKMDRFNADIKGALLISFALILFFVCLLILFFLNSLLNEYQSLLLHPLDAERWARNQPHRGGHGDLLRQRLEPRDGRAGAGPRASHRANAGGAHLPPRVARDD